MLIDYRIWTVTVGGGRQMLSPGRVDYSPAWNGGTWLYFMRGTYNPPNIGELWRMDAAHPDPRAVTQNPHLYKYSPSVRHWDDRIVFEGRPVRGPDERALYLADARTGSITRLSGSGWETDYAPEWSPDGRRVFFVSRRSGHPEVWSLDTESSEFLQVTRTPRGNPSAASVRLSPDRHRMAVAIQYQGPIEIYDLAPSLR